MIVEDDAAVADALATMLAAAGLSTYVFSSAESLIAAGVPDPADTVVVDLGLPGLSGAELVRWLESLDDAPRVIAITGKSSRTIERETQDLPRLRVLRKPPAADWLEAIAG
nr:response regulator [Chthonobacter albigriseus]